MRMSIAALSVLVTLLAASSAPAASTTYATRADWASAVGAFDVEDFETTPVQPTHCDAYLSVPPFGCSHAITIDAPKLDIVIPVGGHDIGADGIFANGLVNGTREFRADLHGGVLIVGTSYNTIVFPQPILAFAVDLANVSDNYLNNCTTNCGQPIPFPFAVSIGGEDFEVANGATFFGMSSTTPFSSLVIRHTEPFVGNYIIPSLDDISFVAVPEPSTGVLLALGLATLARQRRSRAASCSRMRACAARVSG